ncbi:hypothetical protein FHS85_002665 [Rhodoligotrophos appendicifer]|uniref:cytochrome P450 n=1 Tax=Rhodoligotrophos appendicifer TaxID=987056 RepID=UPI00195F622C|nr:cytochrome P450 [Rhodoligotrophos appendicifer]
MWLATRYDEVRTILADPRFSAIPAVPGYPIVAESRAAMLRAERHNFAFMDDPEHAGFRRMLVKMFTVKRIGQMRPAIQKIVDQLLDSLLAKGPPVDFIKDFALPVPSLVISELLAIPYEDHEFFQDCAAARVNLSAPPEVSANAGKKIWDYLDGLLTKREQGIGLGDDLLSQLVIEQIRPGHLAHADAVGTARALLLAGHDTTATQIGAGTLTLLEHPDQLRALIADPSLVPAAVEEILRYFTITHHNAPRVALEDVQIGDQVILAGEGVIASVSAANRDPRAFADPDRFDIHRDANHHLAFAYGVHQCLGQALARLELQIVFETLFRRIPTLRLAVPFEELKFKHESLTFGVIEMPVEW